MKQTLKLAWVRSLPVMAGYMVLGIGFGVLLKNAGYGLIWSFVMSLTIYAGSMQYVGVSLLSVGASVLTVAFTTLLVNARHLFYGLSMIEKYKDAGRKKPYLIFALTDETYSLLCGNDIPKGTEKHWYQFFVSLFNQCYWITGCVLGSLIGTLIPIDTAGIEFSMTALFVTVFVEQWLSAKNHRCAIIGVAASALCLVIFGADNFLLPAMLAIVAALLLLKKEDAACE